MRARAFVCCLLGACSSAPSFTSTCTVGAAAADATATAGLAADRASAILPGGRRVTPAGTLIPVGGFPLAMRALPGGRYVVVSDNAFGDQALRLADLNGGGVVSQFAYPVSGGSGLFYGMALTQDGSRLYVSNGGFDPGPAGMDSNTIDVFDINGAPPALHRNDALTLRLAFHNGVPRLPSGLALSADEKTLYVATQSDGSLAVIDLATRAEVGRAALPGLAPYDVAVDDASHTAFVSLWGGVPGGANQFTDGIVVVDIANPLKPTAAPSPITTGRAAEAELLVAGKLYVTNADADTLSIVDVASRTVRSLPVTAGMILGAAPNQVAFDAGANRLYVANAGENSLVALDAQSLTVLGSVPTGWYPTSVLVEPDGSLVIASAKGLGMGPTDRDPQPNGYMQGILQHLPRPDAAALQAGAIAVAANLDRPRAVAPPLVCPAGATPRFPLPLATKGPTPIQHVFLVVRENKTYDSELGDLAGGNGSTKTLMFGEKVTPNNHALAREFVLLDNYYVQAEQSLQGHEWTTSSIANDYTEKAWLTTGGDRGYRLQSAFGANGTLARLPAPGSGSIFIHLDGAGVAYHNYGEIANQFGAATLNDPSYPGFAFNTKFLDVDKIGYVISNLQDKTFQLEPFSYIGLPNDHTVGTTPGAPTPESMVADNDEATGMFIEALSRSPYWASSIVFVVEDDVSDNGDHVEHHRSFCLIASPWIKRHYHTSTIYDLASIYRTMELLIGIEPMNLYDAHAAPLYELFSTTPDFTPYTHLARQIPPALNTADAPLAAESARIDFSRPDSAPLGRILWKSVHGKDAEPPWGAHAFTVSDDDSPY